MPLVQPLTPCLWFDSQAEEAAKFYTEIFPNSKIGTVSRFTEAGRELHGKEPGIAMSVSFELNGQPFTGLNGGPMYKFTEAISFQIMCQSQEEVDHYWDRLSAGGQILQCGWLTDKFGVTWQVVPIALMEMISGPDPEKSKRMLDAMFPMQKLDIATLKRAYDG